MQTFLRALADVNTRSLADVGGKAPKQRGCVSTDSKKDLHNPGDVTSVQIDDNAWSVVGAPSDLTLLFFGVGCGELTTFRTATNIAASLPIVEIGEVLVGFGVTKASDQAFERYDL